MPLTGELPAAVPPWLLLAVVVPEPLPEELEPAVATAAGDVLLPEPPLFRGEMPTDETAETVPLLLLEVAVMLGDASAGGEVGVAVAPLAGNVVLPKPAPLLAVAGETVPPPLLVVVPMGDVAGVGEALLISGVVGKGLGVLLGEVAVVKAVLKEGEEAGEAI